MTKRTAVTFAIITLIIAFVVAVHIKDQQIAMFPSDHGNLAGNLHNSGLVFEMDGKVYFSNSQEDNCLYSMNLENNKIRNVCSRYQLQPLAISDDGKDVFGSRLSSDDRYKISNK